MLFLFAVQGARTQQIGWEVELYRHALPGGSLHAVGMTAHHMHLWPHAGVVAPGGPPCVACLADPCFIYATFTVCQLCAQQNVCRQGFHFGEVAVCRA